MAVATKAIVGGMSDIDIAFTEDAREYAIAMLREKRAWKAIRVYEVERDLDGAPLLKRDKVEDARYSALLDAWEAADDEERRLRKKMVAEYGDLV